MDFSKVRLDFGKARLRGLPSQDTKPLAQSEKKQIDEPAVTVEAEVPGEVIAHAPQYTATLTPLSRDADKAATFYSLESDGVSGYTLAVTPEGVLVWKRGNDSTLLFPLPANHSVQALFVPPAVGEPATQPGLIMIDRASGDVTYWESVSRAVVSGADAQVDTQVALDRRSGDDQEVISFIESIAPVGLAIGTSYGQFYLLYLRDSLGRRNVRVAALQPSNGILARIRSIGAYARDTRCVRSGRSLPNGERELYIMNMYGDLALWRVGLGGTAVLDQEAQIGAMIHMHMNILYPNSGLSLVVHDVAVESSYTHVLASFAPRHDSQVLYFVIATLTPDLDVVSVQRLQSFESMAGALSERAALHVVDGVICAVLDTAVSFLDSPSRLGSGDRRWEETVALKADSSVVGSAVSQSVLAIATHRGFVSFHFKSDRGSESTTQARLEQAVFDGSPENPLDLTKWSSWEYAADPHAAPDLAVKIATAVTPFVPAQLPSLSAHLELRARALSRLYQQSHVPEVRDIAQSVEASTVLWKLYEAGKNQKPIDEFVKTRKFSVRDLFLSQILSVPEFVTMLATKAKEDSASARALVDVLQACDSDLLGTPQWAYTSNIRLAVETLAAKAADAADPDSLAQTVTLLCAVSSSELLESEPARLLGSLAKLGRVEEALQTARRFKVYNALAAIEVEQWLSSIGSERTEALYSVRSLIAEFGEPLATAIYDACISRGHVAVLVQELAPIDTELAEHIELYLESREMYSVAWTLEPATHRSTDLLGKALEKSSSVDARRLYASLFKLSSLSVGANETQLAIANRELDLVSAQEALASQYFRVSALQSAIAKHAFTPMSQSKPLQRNDAVDLLALAPPSYPADTNDNFIRAFSLVDAHDSVRQRLLVQQLICNTNWAHVDGARDAGSRDTALRRTLFVHTLLHVAPAYAALLSNPQSSWFVPASPEEIQETYPWDTYGDASKELEGIAKMAESIASKYNVQRWISQAGEMLRKQ